MLIKYQIPLYKYKLIVFIAFIILEFDALDEVMGALSKMSNKSKNTVIQACNCVYILY